MPYAARHSCSVPLLFFHFFKKDTKDYIIFALKRNRTERKKIRTNWNFPGGMKKCENTTTMTVECSHYSRKLVTITNKMKKKLNYGRNVCFERQVRWNEWVRVGIMKFRIYLLIEQQKYLWLYAFIWKYYKHNFYLSYL